jgi:hypothetical protein
MDSGVDLIHIHMACDEQKYQGNKTGETQENSVPWREAFDSDAEEKRRRRGSRAGEEHQTNDSGPCNPSFISDHPPEAWKKVHCLNIE